MKKTIFLLVITIAIFSAGCKKTHCYHCVTQNHRLPAMDICSNDTSLALRSDYMVLTNGGTLTDDLGNNDTCRAYDK